MPHATPLISTMVMGLVLAFALGLLAQRLRVSPLVGYLLAGICVGPFTPGFVGDQNLANELAEIGVILLMFGVGIHFSLKDLLAVRAIALPGAVAQILVATVLGAGIGHLFGWSLASGLIFGLALSVASTVVLLKALQERRLINSERGRIAVGWLIVEDLAMVLALVLIPALAEAFGQTASVTLDTMPDIALILGLTITKVGAFAAFMLVVGRKVVPAILHYVAHTGSRELFRLAVLAVSLGIAWGAAMLFGVSFALGAFFAGMVLSESELSHRAAAETLPLRDAFAVLFFVSVGMLFDPRILFQDFWAVMATLAIIVLGKSAAAILIVRAFGHPMRTAAMIAASLAQIGEFSFILANLGVGLELLPERGQDLIMAGAILSILLNPVLFALVDRLEARQSTDQATSPESMPVTAAPPPPAQTAPEGHSIIVGYGRVGSLVGAALQGSQEPFVAIEDNTEQVEQLSEQGIRIISGNAVLRDVMKGAELPTARWLFVTIPNCFEAAQIVTHAREVNPAIKIVARAHADAETEYLLRMGADHVIMGEREIAAGMVSYRRGTA